MSEVPFNRRQDLEAIMAQEPLLSDYGFGTYGEHRREPPARQAEVLAADRRRLLESCDRVQAACRWIETHLTPRSTFNTRRSSYGLKHLAEKDIGYITNGVFIAAMIACGYRYQVCGPNAVFNVSERAVSRVRREQSRRRLPLCTHNASKINVLCCAPL